MLILASHGVTITKATNKGHYYLILQINEITKTYALKRVDIVQFTTRVPDTRNTSSHGVTITKATNKGHYYLI